MIPICLTDELPGILFEDVVVAITTRQLRGLVFTRYYIPLLSLMVNECNLYL